VFDAGYGVINGPKIKMKMTRDY